MARKNQNASAVSRTMAMKLAQLATTCDSLEAYGRELRKLERRLQRRGFPAGKGTWRYYLKRQAAL